MADELDFATCYQILHAGEGERGQSVDVMGRARAGEWYATQAGEYFDDVWLGSVGVGAEEAADECNGSVHHIEVCYPGREPERFVVRCRVTRKYEAEPSTIDNRSWSG